MLSKENENVKRFFCSLAVILFLCLPKLVFGAEKTPSGMISKYFEAYAKKDAVSLILGDQEKYLILMNRMESIPKSIQEEEWKKIITTEIQELDARENNKLKEGTYLKNSLNNWRMTNGGGSLYELLYPEMKYKILEVKEEGATMACQKCSQMAFVEISYKTSQHAPRLNNGAEYGIRVKKAIIKIYLVKYIDSKTKKIAGYTINHYEPTDLKREVF